MGKGGCRSWAVPAAVLVALTMMSVGCGGKGPSAPSGEKGGEPSALKIGFVTNLSVGGATEQGVATRNGFELAINEINANGGINGKQINLIIYDDEAKPEKAVEHVTRMISQDKVLAIAGFVNSGNALAVQQLVQDNKIPLLVNYATATNVTLRFQNEPKNYMFRYSLRDADQVARMLDFVQEQGFKKIAILHDTSGYGVNGKMDIIKQMETRGMKPLMIDTLNTNDTDMTAQLQKFKKSGCDVVMMYNLSPENANTVRSAKKIDYNPVFIGTWSMSFNTYDRLAGDLKNGTLTTTSYIVGQTPKSKELNEKMLSTYNSDILPIGSAFGYDSAYMLAEAIRIGGPDPEKIRDALENLESFDGAVGLIVKPFSQTDHEAISVDHIFIAEWKDNKLEKR